MSEKITQIKQHMDSGTKNKNWFGYTVYVILVTIVLLYFLFPADSVEEFLDNSISRINPELGFTAEKVGDLGYNPYWVDAHILDNFIQR